MYYRRYIMSIEKIDIKKANECEYIMVSGGNIRGVKEFHKTKQGWTSPQSNDNTEYRSINQIIDSHENKNKKKIEIYCKIEDNIDGSGINIITGEDTCLPGKKQLTPT